MQPGSHLPQDPAKGYDMAKPDLVLAITSDDMMFHIGTPEWVLGHLFPQDDPTGQVLALHRSGQTATHDLVGLDLYDASGHALQVNRDVTALVPAVGGEVDPETLVARIDRVLTGARARLADHPGLDVAADAIPGARGPLPAVLAMLDTYGAGSGPGPRPGGSDLHQWFESTRGVLRAGMLRVGGPRVAGRVMVTVSRVPLVSRLAGAVTGSTGWPSRPPPPPMTAIPHLGGWFHNLMHRLSD